MPAMTSRRSATPRRRSWRAKRAVAGPNSLNSGRESLNPPYTSIGEADRGQVISRQPVVAGCDAPEVLQSVERALDAPAQLVDTLAEAERLFSVAAIWNDRLGSALVQVLAQLGAIVGLVAEQCQRVSAAAMKRPPPISNARAIPPRTERTRCRRATGLVSPAVACAAKRPIQKLLMERAQGRGLRRLERALLAISDRGRAYSALPVGICRLQSLLRSAKRRRQPHSPSQ